MIRDRNVKHMTSWLRKSQAVTRGCSLLQSLQINQRLVRPVDEPEIKKALFVMNQNKSPGPDGMTPLFSEMLAYCRA